VIQDQDTTITWQYQKEQGPIHSRAARLFWHLGRYQGFSTRSSMRVRVLLFVSASSEVPYITIATAY
jgi:hypothetical protein